MNKYIIKLFFLGSLSILAIFGCSSDLKKSEYKRRDIKKYYVQSDTYKYFLPTVPKDFHFSQIHRCFIKNEIKYLNLPLFINSYFSNYRKAILFQLELNNKISSFNLADSSKLRPSDFEKIFYESNEKIEGNLSVFILPKYKRIHLVEVDQYINKPNKLKSLFNKSSFGRGAPVVISYCHSRMRLLKFLKKNNLLKYGVQIISNEMFSIFSNELKRVPMYSLNLNQLFGSEKELFLYKTNSKKTLNLKGNYKIIKY